MRIASTHHRPYLTLTLTRLPRLAQLLARRENIRSKAKRQQLAHGPYNVLALLVEHENRRLEPQKLAQKLPAHAAWRAKVGNVRRNTHGLECPESVALNHRRAQGHALGACPHRVCRILNVAARDDGWRCLARRRRLEKEERCADAE
jgi:hypothetical protein